MNLHIVVEQKITEKREQVKRTCFFKNTRNRQTESDKRIVLPITRDD